MNGPYEAEVIPVVFNVMVGLPDTPLPLVTDTPPPAVMVLPDADPLLIPTKPVTPVISALALMADTLAVKATPPICSVPLTFTVELLTCKALAVPSPSSMDRKVPSTPLLLLDT